METEIFPPTHSNSVVVDIRSRMSDLTGLIGAK